MKGISLIKSIKALNTNKFYILSLNNTEVTIFFGRIGSKGQKKKYQFTNEEDALQFIEKRATSKIKSGYWKCSVNQINSMDKNFFIK